ncbi:MAG TPA: choline dehydrogenase [Dehalococcoidia bacterium]|nr:choline dehydrogenase [Dehalococcoidia bacterium]
MNILSNNIPDVLVIGAGASGAALTWSLSKSGIKVVCLEQGDWLPFDAFPATLPESPIRWQTDFHPDPNIRNNPADYPINDKNTPIAPLMYNGVGGSTLHYGSHIPRFHPSDFKVKTVDGIADDWPLTYDEIEPYYDLNDSMLGVSGLTGDPAYPPKPPRPTPPLKLNKAGEALARGFNKLGWHWWHADNANSSIYYDGREPDRGAYLRAYSTPDLIYWPKAIASGAELITNARVREIIIDSQGRATGALYYDKEGSLREQSGKIVILACNGIGTPRILLNSKNSQFPNGLANSNGLVGKNLMHHPCGAVTGLFTESFGSFPGPRGSSMLSQEFYETDSTRGFFRGYDLQVTSQSVTPIATALGGLVGLPVEWGDQHHKKFDERFQHMATLTVMTEDLPEEHNTVTLDPILTDSHGIPAPKIDYTLSENSKKMLDHGVARAQEVLAAAGAKEFMVSNLRRNTGWHLLGTARMGENPDKSVVDRWGKTHDVPNLFIIDGSVFTTGACINPTPTIQALALRTAEYIKGEGNQLLKHM